MAHTFSTSQLPKVVRDRCASCVLTWKCASRHNGVHFFDITTSKVLRPWCALYILTWKRALRHNGVQFFISHLTTWLRTRRFSEPTFRPAGATKHWKNTVFRDFATFSRTCIFFLLTLSLLWSSLFCSSPLWLFPPLLFHLSILSEVWLPNFLRLCSSPTDAGLHFNAKPCKADMELVRPIRSAHLFEKQGGKKIQSEPMRAIGWHMFWKTAKYIQISQTYEIISCSTYTRINF